VTVRRLVRTLCSAVAGLATVAVTAGPAHAAPATDYQMPFSCGQEWSGSTRSYHSPSPNAIDFNRPDDLGQPVLAAARGVVTSVIDLGGRSYGLYIKIAHGNDESTLYAHLNAAYVVSGQRVDQGQVIGTLGSSGGSSGPHLHFEEIKGRSVVAPYFNGVPYRMPQTSASKNCVQVPLPGDWNNTGSAKPGLFHRTWSGAFVMKTGKTVLRTQLGRGIDWPLVGDWDGDGRTDVGLKRAMTGQFVLRGSGGTVDRSIVLGGPRDIGVAGDWDGNKRTDVGIWRPKEKDFQVRFPNGVVQRVAPGSSASLQLPVTGDVDGDRRDDVGVFDVATATWTWRSVKGVALGTLKAGVPYELPVAADFNGDGRTDLGTWNRATGVWTLRVVKADGTIRYPTKHFGS
jgi:hypothetical protein